ncbi:MAG: anti-sigma-factor antagonist and glycosyl transferase [Chloroflexi bacterium]|nr:anti-sigma-factor antagonist and glycosyl transferase [Chloroflexota bacterium]
MRTQLDLLGTLIDCVDAPQALSQIDDFVRSGRFHQVVTVNVDFLRLASKDRGFQNLVNNADLVLADGMPLVWASRRRSTPLPCRVTGIDMILSCAQLAASRGYSIFLLGAAPGVAREAGEVLQQRFPGLRIAGTYSPPTTEPADQEQCVRMVRAAQPDMLFVAFGAPKQDEWICQHQDRLDVPVCMGVGGSFDMLTGNVRRAPLWIQRRGLEWLYRLVQEPRRLWKRYIVHDLPVFARLMFQSRESTVVSQPATIARPFESASTEAAFAEQIFAGEASSQMSELAVRVGQSA